MISLLVIVYTSDINLLSSLVVILFLWKKGTSFDDSVHQTACGIAAILGNIQLFVTNPMSTAHFVYNIKINYYKNNDQPQHNKDDIHLLEMKIERFRVIFMINR